MKYLITLMLLVASTMSVGEVTVRRILPDEVRIVSPGEPLRFWREVCVNDEDTTMNVVRIIRNLNDNPDTFIKLPSVQYGGFADDGCQASLYEVTIPTMIEPGDYVYEPRGVLSDGTVIELPGERFKVSY
jgi:hypothetical protein